MVSLIIDLVQEWRRLDERIAAVSAEIEALAEAGRRLRAPDDRAGGWPDHLKRRGGGDRQRHRLQAGTRLRGLAGARAEAGVDRGPHDPGQDLQTWQQIHENTVRAGRARRPGAAAEHSNAWSVALDRAGIEACCTATCSAMRSPTSSPASPGLYSRRGALTQRDGSPPMQHDKGSLRSTKGIPATPPPPSARLMGERAKVAPRGWLHVISLTSNIRGRPSSLELNSFPAKACEME